jgi:pimeloyl-ACP methyl ester carboxylesterase
MSPDASATAETSIGVSGVISVPRPSGEDAMQRADGHQVRLDGREQTCLIDSGRDGLQLFLRGLRSTALTRRGVVLYLHGATFPSALSVAYRFDGMSWRDAMCDAGFDVWALDSLGFGGSDRYPEMEADADAHAPLGLAADAVAQVVAAVRFILDHGGHQRASLVTHSWGSMPAGLFAAKHPTLVDRIVMFAPLARREGPRYTPRPTLPAWKLVTNDQQWARFVEDVPRGEPPVLAHGDFTAWSEAYLDSDPTACSRSPPAVKTPTGPLVEILRAWHGELAWEPQEVQAPVAIIRGVGTAWSPIKTPPGYSSG